MATNKTAAARGEGGDRGLRTPDRAECSSPPSPPDQEARHEALALLTRAYRSACAEAGRHDELATNITGIGRALRRGIYDPGFALDRLDHLLTEVDR